MDESIVRPLMLARFVPEEPMDDEQADKEESVAAVDVMFLLLGWDGGG